MGLKILVSADWHLESPLAGHPELRPYQREIPGRIAELAKQKGCGLALLAGDLFDGAYTAKTLSLVTDALEKMGIPVFISPGNHDYFGGRSPYDREIFPDNVYIFREGTMTAVPLPELSCTVYGGAFSAMDAPAMLRNFRAKGEGTAIGILHGDPTDPASFCCPVTAEDVKASGLDFLALGHIHKSASFRVGNTDCLVPGCPMGRDFGETGEKGAWIYDTEEKTATFYPLGLPCFYTQTLNVDNFTLPFLSPKDYYRITLVGRGEKPELPVLPNVVWRDASLPPLDIWRSASEDSLEGLFFRKLRDQAEKGDETALLAAELTRLLLDGEEVLPC